MKHMKHLLKCQKLVNEAILAIIDADDMIGNEVRLQETDKFSQELYEKAALLQDGVRSFMVHSRLQKIQGTLFGDDDDDERESKRSAS